MYTESELYNVVNKMSRTDFHKKIIRGVCRTSEFGHLISAGVQDLLPAEKRHIRVMLLSTGIPQAYTDSDEDLELIAQAIVSRSVTLK